MENGKELHPLEKNWPIRPILGEPPIKPDTDRHRKMKVVMKSNTVGDALKNLKQLEKPVGGMRDVRLALHKGAVEIFGVELTPTEKPFM